MIRPATIHDALQAAPLLCAAWGHLSSALTGAADDDEARQIVARFFAQPGNRLSYENALVAEHDRHMAGVAVCYHGTEAEALDRPLKAQLITRTGDVSADIHVEAAPDEFYLDTLSVHPDYQRRGIGTELLRAFERLAAERGCRKLGLLVEHDNDAAQRLYIKAGFTADSTLTLADLLFDHMGKRL